MSYFIESKEYIKTSSKNRKSINPNNLATWGIDYLDDHFGGGIPPRSFNLLACESGKGKTTFVSDMAVQNSKRGKKVAFIRLEGDMFEFADTEKWKVMYDSIEEMVRTGKLDKRPDYQAYRLNNVLGIEFLEEKAEVLLADHLKNVLLFDKSKQSINRNTISDILNGIESFVDLVIIDHLHYFEIVDERQQYREQMETVKLINEFVDKSGIPVVLVSHIRKRDSKFAKGLLKMDDIQGSSDIFKIAHTVLFMSPYYEEYDLQNKIYPTLFYSPKSRYGAPTTRIGIKKFDGKSKKYKEGYEIAEQKIIKGEWTLERKTSRPKIGQNNF